MAWLADMFTERKQKLFLELLREHCGLLLKAAQALERYVEREDQVIAEECEAVEKRGDEVLKQTIDALTDTFITPFDRQDIYSLAESIDDMIDALNNAVREMVLFKTSPTPAVVEMVHILVAGANELNAAVADIDRDPKAAAAHAAAASATENRIEDLYRRTLAALFEETDFQRILKLREIYRHLSNSGDRADAIGRLIGKVVVKVA